jgi:hypothetical protein
MTSGRATPAASTRTRTSPPLGSGHSSSTTRSTSGPPYSLTTMRVCRTISPSPGRSRACAERQMLAQRRVPGKSPKLCLRPGAVPRGSRWADTGPGLRVIPRVVLPGQFVAQIATNAAVVTAAGGGSIGAGRKGRGRRLARTAQGCGGTGTWMLGSLQPWRCLRHWPRPSPHEGVRRGARPRRASAPGAGVAACQPYRPTFVDCRGRRQPAAPGSDSRGISPGRRRRATGERARRPPAPSSARRTAQSQHARTSSDPRSARSRCSRRGSSAARRKT